MTKSTITPATEITTSSGQTCLACYGPLPKQPTSLNQIPTNQFHANEYHAGCVLRVFGLRQPPELDVSLTEVRVLARQLIAGRRALTGVQPKLSLEETPRQDRNTGRKISGRRLTLLGAFAGVRGHFILKPPSERFQNLPEIEDLTMHLASLCRIVTANHALIRLRSGELA